MQVELGVSGDLPAGELDQTVTLSATDAAGNTRSESQVIRFDTLASDAPEVTDYTRNHTGLTGVSIETTGDAIYIGHLDGAGGIEDVGFSSFAAPGRTDTSYFFDETVPDGSHLVVTGTDAAGNVAGTFHVVDDPLTNQVGMNDALAQSVGQVTEDGETFNVFVIGDSTVRIEDDITNVVI